MTDQSNDIEKYLRGELTPAEMHSLEKRALSDPFLADALEGASAVGKDDFATDVASLRQRMKGSARKVVPLWATVSRIAAGIAVIGVVVYLVFNTARKDEKLAQNEPKQPAEESVSPPHRPSADSIVAKESDSRSAQDQAQTSDKPVQSPAATQRDALSRQRVREIEPTGEEVAAANIEEGFVSGVQNAPATPMAEEFEDNLADIKVNLDSAVLAKAETPKPESERKNMVIKPAPMLTGRVVDAEGGNGLPGVNVIAKGKTVGTITDEEGRYKIPLDSIDDGLLFSFIGYENKEIENPANNLDVVLNPDISQLSEVVVVGYGGNKREDPIFDPVMELAEPIGGRKAYRNYLQQNIRYPQQALNSKVEGKVTVQFTLEPNGNLTNFRVVRGLGYGCDEEVIRLIKEGPKWNPSRKNTEPITDRVKVRVRFALPKNSR